MKSKTTRLKPWIFCGVVASSLAVVYGCSSSSDSTGPANTAEAGQDAPTTTTDTGACVDPPNCVHCADLSSSRCESRAAVCNCNSPSSTQLAAAIAACTCQQQCVTECGASCSGQGDPSQECLTCEETKCSAPAIACFGDIDTFDPTCNPTAPPPPDSGADSGIADAGDAG